MIAISNSILLEFMFIDINEREVAYVDATSRKHILYIYQAVSSSDFAWVVENAICKTCFRQIP